MRFLAIVCFALWCVATTRGAESKGRPASLQISGQSYVSLNDWAAFKKWQLVRRNEEIRLTNSSNAVTLKANSLRANVNGVTLFLSYPVYVRQGTVWVAKKDMDGSLEPILSPPKNKPGQRVRVIAISAGHGGKDSGYKLGSHLEKKYTLLLAKELQRRCIRAGLKTVMVRSSDKYLTLADRTRLAKSGKADLLLELHYNSGGPGDRTSRGAEVYCLTLDGAASTNGGADRYRSALAGNRHDEQNILLAYQVQSSLVKHASMADRGVRRARFEVLRDADMPAVLIEAGFMSQPDEMRNIESLSHRRRTAQAILDGILAYKKAVDH